MPLNQIPKSPVTFRKLNFHKLGSGKNSVIIPKRTEIINDSNNKELIPPDSPYKRENSEFVGLNMMRTNLLNIEKDYLKINPKEGYEDDEDEWSGCSD